MRACLLPLMLLAIPCAASAAQPACPRNLQWSDATYLQGTTTQDARSNGGELRIHTNAHAWRLQLDGTPIEIITMAPEVARGVVLLHGGTDEGPAQFAEVGVALALPMADGAIRGMAQPCDLPDAVARPVDGSDFLVMGKSAADPGKVKGSVTRHGLRVTYAFQFYEDGGMAGQHIEGAWEAGTRQPLPLALDVRAWRVYRNNVMVAGPTSGPRTLGDALTLAAAFR